MLHPDTFNRLSLGIIEKENCSPEAALEKLQQLAINLNCGDAIKQSLPLQAALLTAVNTAKRAFLGGVYVKLSDRIPSLIKWPSSIYLNDIIVELGGTLVDEIPAANFCLTFGCPVTTDEQLQVVCNNWQAGVTTENIPDFISNGSIPTAGIFAGSLGVFLAFLKSSGINISCCDQSQGISLWRPDLNWLHNDAVGVDPIFLPQKYWLLGLGHLGQAYLWNIGLLPYMDASKAKVILQDDDKVVEANWSAGLLAELALAGKKKARVCSTWLEQREFETAITERRFDQYTIRSGEEPFAALCGFDSAKSRLPLENAGFDLIAEAGLGNNLSTFDRVSFHTFPNSLKKPSEIWNEADDDVDNFNEKIFNQVKPLDKEVCGIIPMRIANKSVSASFVGACTGALIIAEMLRALHGGFRYDKISFQLRDITGRNCVIHKHSPYTTELSRNGFLTK